MKPNFFVNGQDALERDPMVERVKSELRSPGFWWEGAMTVALCGFLWLFMKLVVA